MKLRVVKTASNSKAVQVIRYQNNKRIIIKHIGSTQNEEELENLLLKGEEWIKDFSSQLSLFPDQNPNSIINLHHCSFIGVMYHFYYQVIQSLQEKLIFDDLPAILKDLISIRIFEPASKLRSLELMEQYFGVIHQRKNYYKIAPQYSNLKNRIEEKAINFAKKYYSFNYDLLFYDVTTLYFESFEEDELRKNGFSKDNKSQQPQILVALMVTKEGFPVAYEVFAGSTFEGHTIIPVIKDFINKNGVKEFTVVADAAMISTENIKQLSDSKINYIVGARLGNISKELFESINQSMAREDEYTIRLKTNHGYLVCSYSKVRYNKDKYEMEKQVEKAKNIVLNPSKNKKVKFTHTKGEQVELNQNLIEKTKKLLGIKGYYTNLEEETISNNVIIERYHQLYKIEQAFRISKNDLQTRPIFHFKEDPIKLHILICFAALLISKHIELKTSVSIKKFVSETKKITDGKLLNHFTDKIVTISAKPTSKMLDYLKLLDIPH